MDYVDVKYINSISSRLQKFKKVKPQLYNFRCPLCGDSKKNKNKARGYFYQIKNNTNFKCHNCGLNISFNNFLKQFDSVIYKEYIFEKFKDGHTGKNYVTDTPEDIFKKVDKEKPTFKKKINMKLPSAFDVQISKRYLYDRAIFDGNFYYVEKFKEWVNTVKPTFDNLDYDDDRIIIPLVMDSKLIGFQGRSIHRGYIKYITIMLNEEAPKIYGFDTIDKKLPVYVVEGPFDSTFLNNSVALCGSDGDVACLEGCDIVYAYDNEPRNKEIVDRVERSIGRGDKVVIWPGGINQKDINEMVLFGHEVQKMVELNTYSGLEAKLKFNSWKKI